MPSKDNAKSSSFRAGMLISSKENIDISMWFENWVLVECFVTNIKRYQERRKKLNTSNIGSSQEMSSLITLTNNLRLKILNFEEMQKARVHQWRGEWGNLDEQLQTFKFKRDRQDVDKVLNGELAYGNGVDMRWDLDTIDGIEDEDLQLSKEIEMMELDDKLFQNLLNYEATMYWVLDKAMKEFVLEAKLSDQEAIVWKLKDLAPGPRLFEDLKDLETMKAATLQWLQDVIEEKAKENKAELGRSNGLSVGKSNQGKHDQQKLKAEKLLEEQQQETSKKSDFNTKDHTEISKSSTIEPPAKDSGEWVQELVVRYSWEPLYPTPTFSYKGIPWDEKHCFKCSTKGHFDNECSHEKQTKSQPNALRPGPGHAAKPPNMVSSVNPNSSDCGNIGYNKSECASQQNFKRTHGSNDGDVEKCRDILPESMKDRVCSYCGEGDHRDGECWYIRPEKQEEFFRSRRYLCKRNAH